MDGVPAKCPKKLFNDQPATVIKFNVQPCLDRKWFGANLATYARQMQIQHLDRSNNPRAKPDKAS